MADPTEAVKDYSARLERDLGLNPNRDRVTAELRGGVLYLAGEVDDIAVKRRAARLALEMFGADGMQDEITLRPAQERQDGAIRDSLLRALMDESVFRRFGINLWLKEEMHIARDVRDDSEGHLDVIVDEGTITLSGEAWSISHRRMAELLAWWTPGVRGVVNGIAVNPPEVDTDDDITDAVRLALDKDPLVHSGQIRVTTRAGTVLLDGLVPQPEERRMAEQNVWYLGGTDIAAVENRIQVQQAQPAERA